MTRIEIAKPLCYHKKYLRDKDLREGYDSILKKVEQGKLNWSNNLSEKLHEYLDYSAKIIVRDQVTQQEGFLKGKSKKTNTSKKANAKVQASDVNNLGVAEEDGKADEGYDCLG